MAVTSWTHSKYTFLPYEWTRNGPFNHACLFVVCVIIPEKINRYFFRIPSNKNFHDSQEFFGNLPVSFPTLLPVSQNIAIYKKLRLDKEFCKKNILFWGESPPPVRGTPLKYLVFPKLARYLSIRYSPAERRVNLPALPHSHSHRREREIFFPPKLNIFPPSF